MNQELLLPFFHELADAADHITIEAFKSALDVTSKHQGFDPVTRADQDAERALRALIEREFPGHGIIGEEFGIKNEHADYVWVLDPIDGTRAYIAGIPTWGTLIGLLHMGKPFMGMVSQGFTRERWWGDGATAFYTVNRRLAQRLQTRQCHDIAQAQICTTSPDLFATPQDYARFCQLKHCVRTVRYGGDCYNYMSLAAGLVDCVVESGLKPYDILPLIPIIEGAGGVITDWNGNADISSGQVIVSATQVLHNNAILALRI